MFKIKILEDTLEKLTSTAQDSFVTTPKQCHNSWKSCIQWAKLWSNWSNPF